MTVEGKTENKLCLRLYDFPVVGVWLGAEQYAEEMVEWEWFGGNT